MDTTEPRNKTSIEDGENRPIVDSPKRNFQDSDFRCDKNIYQFNITFIKINIKSFFSLILNYLAICYNKLNVIMDFCLLNLIKL